MYFTRDIVYLEVAIFLYANFDGYDQLTNYCKACGAILL